MKTEAWWVCRCGALVARVGKGVEKKHEEHAKTCSNPGYHIKQIAQGKEVK